MAAEAAARDSEVNLGAQMKTQSEIQLLQCLLERATGESP
jgi:hypothetical protein